MSFLIKSSGFKKLLLYLRVVARYTSARNACINHVTRSISVGFADLRRQSYKKILNFEAFFVKISSSDATSHGVPKPLLRSYCRKQKQFRCAMV